MKRLLIALLVLSPVAIARAETRDELERPFISRPTAKGWKLIQPGRERSTPAGTAAPDLVSGVPGRVVAHAIRKSKAGAVLAEAVLLDKVPQHDWGFRFAGGDSEIEPLPPPRVPLFNLRTVMKQMASNLGASSVTVARGYRAAVSPWKFPAVEAWVFTGPLVPRWRMGAQYFNFGGGRFAVLVYRVASCHAQADLWPQIGTIAKSVRFLKPA
jgi:hypothetical protein